MEFEQTVRKRRMVRAFSDRPVDPSTITGLLDLARRAPSAGFTQGQSFVTVTDPALRATVARICGEKHYVESGYGPWISSAPVLVVPCTSEEAYHRRYREPDKLDPDGREIDWPVPYWFFDLGAAVMVLLLGVVDRGLAAGFAGPMDLDALRQALGLPQEVTPVGVIPIGHPAPDKRSPSLKRGRRPLDDVVRQERW
jgi:nitroreductase